jgi:FkbM family methyltransferase
MASLKTSGSESDTPFFVQDLFSPGFGGVYVDVGAGYPEYYSATFPLRKKGWQIIAIEPQPQMCAEFEEMGLPVLQYACTDRDIGEADFEVLDYMRGLGGSSFKVVDPQPLGRKVVTIQVQALTLNTILKRHHPDLEHIDVLGVDVECYEVFVLRGLDFERYAPDVLVIENLPRELGWLNPHQEELEELYNDFGYEVIARAGYNDVLRRVS